MTTAAETVKQEEPISKLDWDCYIIAEVAICYPPGQVQMHVQA